MLFALCIPVWWLCDGADRSELYNPRVCGGGDAVGAVRCGSGPCSPTCVVSMSGCMSVIEILMSHNGGGICGGVCD